MSSADSPSLLGLVRFTVDPPVKGDFPLPCCLEGSSCSRDARRCFWETIFLNYLGSVPVCSLWIHFHSDSVFLRADNEVRSLEVQNLVTLEDKHF